MAVVATGRGDRRSPRGIETRGSDPRRRRQLAQAGRRRLAAFDLPRCAAELLHQVHQGLVNAELLAGRASWTTGS